MTVPSAHPDRGSLAANFKLLVATGRTMLWTPLLCALGLLTVTTVVWTRLHATPSLIAATVVAAFAATGCAALGDPAHLLLESVSTSRLVRLSHRVALAVAAIAVGLSVIALWARLVATVARLNVTKLGPPSMVVAETFALFSFGVAVHSLIQKRTDRADEVAALATFGWFVSPRMIPDRFKLDLITFAWRDRPWLVFAATLVVTVVHQKEWRWRARRKFPDRSRTVSQSLYLYK